MEQLTTNATDDSRSRSSLLSLFTTWLAMTLIYSLKISANPKKTSNAFQIMRKNTSVSVKISLLALSSTKKVKQLT